MQYNPQDIEIFVATYNRAEFLNDTLSSIANQSIQGFKVIVLDNGSTDNTPEVVQKYSSYGFILAKSIKNEGHLGNFYRAQKTANSRWTILFHDDDLMHPYYIENVLNLINSNKNLSLIGSKYTQLENPKNIDWENIKVPDVLYCKNIKDFAGILVDGFAYHFASSVYKTELFKTTILEYEKYGKICDRPFLLEAAKDGEIAVFNTSFIRYRHHSGQDTVDYKSGPFAKNWIALQNKYKNTLGNTLLDEYGKIYTVRALDCLLSGYTWVKAEHQKYSKQNFVKLAQKEGVLGFWQRLYLMFSANKVIRGSVSKWKNKIIKDFYKKLKLNSQQV